MSAVASVTARRRWLRRGLDAALFALTVGAIVSAFWEKVPSWMQFSALAAFVACFLCRWRVDDEPVAYMRRNWLDLVFVVLLASPLLRLFSFLRFTRLHPLLRLGMLIRRHKRQVLRLILLSRDSFPVAMAVLFLMVFLFGTAAWMLEHGSNPAFAEVGDGLWWAFVTLTTVGYGDIVPVTEGGRIVAVLTMVFGIAVYSLLIANLTHFLETLEPSRQADAGAEAAVSEPARATSEEA